MRDYLSKHENPGIVVARTRGRVSLRESLIAMGIAALTGCGEIVPINPDGGTVPPDAVPADNADLAILDLGAFGDLTPAFDPAETSYRASFSLLVQGLEVAARPANPASSITINGVSIVPGQRADDVSLDAAAETPITIEVQAPAGNIKTYSIIATRDAPVRQYVYGKASNPGAAADPFGQDAVPGNEIGDEFAFWLDTDGDTIVVGAHLEDSSARGIDGNQLDENAPSSGAAYVYRRQDNAWKQEAYLKASNTDPFDEFGRGVAIDNNVIAVGAPFESSAAAGVDGDQEDDGLSNSGAVYIFRRAGDVWQQEAYIKASNPQDCGLFGLNIALDDDVLVVGAPGCFDPGFPDDYTGFPNDGAAYVFRYNGVTWVEEAILKASNAEPGDQFGFQVSVDDDIIAVSAFGESSSIGGDAADPATADNLAPMSGAVYTFARQEDGAWVQTDYLKSQSPGGRLLTPPACFDADGNFECEGDRFGIRVELDEDTLVVGGYLDDSASREINGDQTDNSAPDAGGAWVYRRNPDGTWSQEAYLKPDNLDPEDFFGQNFELSGDLLAVAANGESSGARGVGGDGSSNGAQSSGAVYLFQRTGTTWQQIEYIKASNAERFDNFGFNIAMSSTLLVVGSVWEWGGVPGINGDENDQSGPVSGAFYVFQ
ncbi:MAG TPA: cadherin-like beta sandwich domain-containing protein [Haliangium sp.]|nr:cadherin-like beta sandwich domain-containing protein [Haliangium sp.]